MVCYLTLCSSVAVTGFFLVFVMQRIIVVHKLRVTSNYFRATRVILLSLLWDMYSQPGECPCFPKPVCKGCKGSLANPYILLQIWNQIILPTFIA